MRVTREKAESLNSLNAPMEKRVPYMYTIGLYMAIAVSCICTGIAIAM